MTQEYEIYEYDYTPINEDPFFDLVEPTQYILANLAEECKQAPYLVGTDDRIEIIVFDGGVYDLRQVAAR